MESLHQEAARRSGVTKEEALQLDSQHLYHRFGQQALEQLSHEFYRRVFADEQEPWFRNIFSNVTRRDAIQNQVDFFVERLGGPPTYTERKGSMALIGRHAPYEISERSARRWLQHMEAAMEDVPVIADDEEGSAALRAFLRHTAYFLVAGKGLVNACRPMVGYGVAEPSKKK
eukprot:jgi/Mesvir1/811/Mv17401-RA.1